MIRDTSAFSLSSCPKASLTWVRGSARDENSVHPSGSISARITMGPAHVSTIAPFGVVVCHGANWYEAPISKFSLRNSSSVRLKPRAESPTTTGTSGRDGLRRAYPPRGERDTTVGNRGVEADRGD